MARNSVDKYLRLATAAGVQQDGEPPGEEVVRQLVAQSRPGPRPGSVAAPGRTVLEERRERTATWPQEERKTFLAQALGGAATRAGHSVLFRRSDYLLRELSQSRADHTFEAVFRRYLAPDLLIVDDFGLHRLSQQQSEDLYALIIERHRRSSFIVTSNRDVSEWVSLFADPILANSALDRLANGAHQLVIEGPSYRAKLARRPPWSRQ